MSCQSAPAPVPNSLLQHGRTEHSSTRALPEGPGVSRGPHEMPLVPFL
ncbi:unnamed protein product [Staurois parvus]|uniref:Uncharacterized protein n=1 Tax=Staurois parvus TaxID=386267 RepID=A0ABN9HMY0_9NEOB|nr:unnamed protein product [Staurois parvus]